jgi:hypothetical protein
MDDRRELALQPQESLLCGIDQLGTSLRLRLCSRRLACLFAQTLDLCMGAAMRTAAPPEGASAAVCAWSLASNRSGVGRA